MYTAEAPAIGGRRDHAYQVLKRDLLAGGFALGERLAEERLAARLSVSRTPVREALSRLYSEGFVSRLPDGGFCPAAPDLPTTRERYEVRFALERHALTHPVAGGHDRAALEALAADWEAIGDDVGADEPDPTFVLLDEDFHLRLALAAGNRALVDVLTQVNEHIRLVRVHDFLTAARVERTVDQHLAIVRALLAGQPIAAEQRLVHHLGESLDVVEQRAAAALARMARSDAERRDR